MDKEKFTELANKHLFALEGYEFDKEGNTKIKVFGIEKLYEAINYSQCCTEFADGKCRPMVNADWTYLKCDCGKRFEPKG